ncbi:hypothetical protein FV217_16800 [Methylobacterium sp. WL9]|nr:hypothetical protein FV217_16800 [Methylobacterium sp. WL9]
MPVSGEPRSRWSARPALLRGGAGHRGPVPPQALRPLPRPPRPASHPRPWRTPPPSRQSGLSRSWCRPWR